MSLSVSDIKKQIIETIQIVSEDLETAALDDVKEKQGNLKALRAIKEFIDTRQS